MPESTQSIAILGGGVGGLCCAIALAKQGRNVTVYERSKAPRTAGAGMMLWPNACCVLDRLGLLERIATIGTRSHAMRRFSQTGQTLGHISVERIEHTIGYPAYAVTRAGLQTVLLDAVAKLGVPVAYDHCVRAIQSDSNGAVVVRFANHAAITPQIVIGADGRMNSIARRYVLGPDRPLYQGYVNWLGLAQSASPLVPNTDIRDFWGVGERFGLVPLSQHQAYWAGCKALPAGLGEPSCGNRAALAKIFDGWPHPIAAVMRASQTNTIKRIEVYDLEPTRPWHRERVCLVGDAAHAALPTSGQGACQAMEDAYHLAACMTASPDNAPLAFAQYEAIRWRKTTTITKAARQFASSLFSSDVVACKKRDEAASASDGNAAALGMAQLWGQELPGARAE